MADICFPQYRDLIKQTTAGAISGIKSQGQELPKDFATKMEAVMREALPYDELLSFNAQVYGARFSDAELQELITFYKTPTGAKLVRLLPAISGEVGQKLAVLIPQRLPAIMKKARHRLMLMRASTAAAYSPVVWEKSQP